MFPTLYEDLKSIQISKLKEWGYLEPDQVKWGNVSWSRNGVKTAEVAIQVCTEVGNSFIKIDYRCNGVPISQLVNLDTVPSNLGKGFVWYFLCPVTQKRCRKLYLIDKYFTHRSAFGGCRYEKQTHSHRTRDLYRTFGKAFAIEDVAEQVYKKNFKAHYKGKPTKRYQKLLRKVHGSNYLPQMNHQGVSLNKKTGRL